MSYRVDELLLIENITYIPDLEPLKSVLCATGKTVAEYLDMINMEELEDTKDYASFYNGFDFKNTLTAIKKNPAIMNAKIVDSYIDRAYGGGGGIVAVFVNEEYREAVVAFRGTASLEWADDMEGAAVVDTLQQINALEYFRTVVRRHKLNDYYITVTGHSKGGNKAKYITVLDDTPDRCVSFDGQGFSDKFMNHYRDRILKRQDVIQNHNVDYDYVNFLLNDIGEVTYYHGYDYGRGGFAEAHSPNTFFDFSGPGEYTMTPNPAGQSTEIQLLDQFLNSLLRSMPNDKELGEAAEMVGILVEKSFDRNKSEGEFINLIFDLVSDPKYSDNVAFLIAFFIKYERVHPGFVNTIGGIMDHFGMESMLRYIEIVRSILEWKMLDAIIGLTDFVVGHIPSPLLKQLQKYLNKKLGVNLDKEQLREVLSVVTMTNEALKNLRISDDGSDIIVTEEEMDEEEERIIPEKLDILVLAGGLSPERNVSLMTGHDITEILRNKGHRVIILDSYLGYSGGKTGLSEPFHNPEKYSLKKVVEADLVPDLWAVRRRRRDNEITLLGPNVVEFAREADIVFLALPGSGNEVGRIQGMFDLYGIDYTGSSVMPATLAMNKSYAKQIFVANHVPTPKWTIVKRHDGEIRKLPEGLAYPVVVKPNGGGASVGVAAVNDDISLNQAVNAAFKWENEIIIEEYISGREFSVSMIGEEVFPIVEVDGKDEVYDAKYQLYHDASHASCPAKLPEEVADSLKKTAFDAAKCLGINSHCRVDFRMNLDGEIYCLECDALPALTKGGRFARAAAAAGIEYEEMCEKIIQISITGRYWK